MNDFQNKLAVVFGGGRDIGGAVAVELARRGAQVAFSYQSSDPGSVIDAIAATGQTPYSQKVDAMDMAAVRKFAVSSAERAGKQISVLVNVVGGLIARKRMEEMDDAFWDQVMTLNTKSIFAMTQASLPLMIDGGAIVNVSSQAGRD
ncbi:MAG TPA: SDR family oxidoreductase, partial [Edaphobacter sp.]